MRRILAATLIGVLTGSLLTTIEPVISTPPPAEATPVTVGNCEVDVTFADESALPDGAIAADGSHVKVTSDADGCLLEFLHTDADMLWTPPSSLPDMQIVVVAGGGGGGVGGGGAGGYEETATLSSSDVLALGGSIKIRVGNGGLGAASFQHPPGNGENSFLIGSNDDSFASPPPRSSSTTKDLASSSSEAIIMRGGGGGAYFASPSGNDAADGGSGGGGAVKLSANQFADRGSPSPTGYGNYGGSGVSEINNPKVVGGADGLFAGMGGGGAGGSGSHVLLNGSSVGGGGGGVGISSSVLGRTVAAGGGGGVCAESGFSEFGGNGANSIGGDGGTCDGGAVERTGEANTGSGGGGNFGVGGAGGSGIVAVSYSLPAVDPAPVLGSVTRTAGGFTAEITNFDAVNAVADSFSVSGTNGASVSRSGSTVTVTGLSDGASSTVTVTASASGFSDATGTVTGEAKSAQATLSMSSASTIGYLGSLSLTSSGGSGDGAVSFSVTGTGCSVLGSTLSVNDSAEVDDTCTVSATKDADTDYREVSSAGQTVTVVEANQASLTITNSGDVGLGGSVELVVSGGSGTGSVTFSESCADFSISGATLSTTATVGTTCTVTAEKAASTNYNSATATKDFTVGKASPVFDSYDPVSAQVGSADVTLTDPTVQVNGSAFTAGSIGWTSADDTVADVTGSTLSFESVGETTLTATFTPTDSSSYETVTLAVTVTVTAVPPAPRGGNDDDEATPVPTAGPTVGPAVPGRPSVPGGVPGRPGGNTPGGVTPGGGTPPPPPGGTVGSPVAPERPGATIGGQPVPTTTTASPGGRGVSVSAGGVDVGVDVPDPGDGAGGVIDRGGIPEPVVTPGQGKTVSGAGAAPGSVVDVWLPGRGNTGPTNIAQIPVGEDGTFSADVDVFAGSDEPLPIGRNVVQIVTTNAEGEDIVVDMPFTITQGEPAPEVLRASGETPNAPVVGVVATNKGEPETVTIDSEPTQGSIRVTADAWDFTISVDTATSSVQGSDTTTTIAATNTTEVTVSGSGFMADTRVDVWAFSTPALLASATVTTEGTATVTVELDPTVLTGEHTLQLQAVGDDGYVRTANLPVTLTNTPPTTTHTANSLLWWTVGLIALIILAAVVTTLVIRRRQVS